MDHLNREESSLSLYINREAAQSARENVNEAMRAILGEIAERAQMHLKGESLKELAADSLLSQGPHNALNYTLSRWAESSKKPIVLLIDEIDSLVGESFERKFRSDDIEYVLDLGLISQDRTGAISIANQIYPEIISRQLTWDYAGWNGSADCLVHPA